MLCFRQRRKSWRQRAFDGICFAFIVFQLVSLLVMYLQGAQREVSSSDGFSERQLLSELTKKESAVEKEPKVEPIGNPEVFANVRPSSSVPPINDSATAAAAAETRHIRPLKQYRASDEDNKVAAVLANSNFQELLRHKQYNYTYNDFSYTMPRFVTSEDVEIFRSDDDNTADLYVPDDVKTSRLRGVVKLMPGAFASSEIDCGYKSNLEQFRRRPIRPPRDGYGYLCPLLVPEGASYQHFVDGVLPKIIQSYEILKSPEVKILIYPPKDRITKDILETMGFGADRVVHYKTGYYSAEHQINTCITPPLHPVLWQKARRVLGIPESSPRSGAPSVVLLVRKHVGRQIQNLKEVTQFLKERYGERLKTTVFVSTLEEGKTLMANASVIIGVHGGGFYNMLYAPPAAAIVELLPVNKRGAPTPHGLAHKIVWQMAQTMGHSFWRMAIKTFSGRGDVVVPVDKLKVLLDQVDNEDFYAI